MSANAYVATLLADQRTRLDEYVAACEADTAARLALWSAEATHEDALIAARVNQRLALAESGSKLTVDAMKDSLAYAVQHDAATATARGEWEWARAQAAQAATRLSIARARLRAATLAVAAVTTDNREVAR